MIKTKHLLLIFVPAILLAGFAFFMQVIQFKPLFPKQPEASETPTEKPPLVALLPNDPILGDKKAGKTVVVFGDFSCAGCKTQDMYLEELITTYPGKVKVIWKGLPVAKFPHDARQAHSYAHCANQQNKFIEFQKFAFSNNESLSEAILKEIASEIQIDQTKFDSCLNNPATETYIKNTETIALSVNVQAVPAVFIDNKQIPAPNSLDEWKRILGF